MKTQKRPNIYSYLDHRQFLRDQIGYLKENKDGFSLRRVATLSGLSSGYLPMALSGDRALTHEALEKISEHLDLDATEISYLHSLRDLGESNIPAARARALEKISKFKEYKKLNPKELEAYKYLTRWYFVAIREMATVDGFKLDPEWIKERLRNKVTTLQVKDAIEFLLEFGFLVRTKDGSAKAAEKQVQCLDGVFRVAMAEFHSEMLKLAMASIGDVPREKRMITSHTLAVNEDGLKKIKEIMDEALQKIRDVGEKTKSAQNVYHVELAGFPLTKVDS